MKFSEFKEMVLLETSHDKDTKRVFDGLFEQYNDTDDVDLEDLKEYIEDLENNDTISEVADSLVDVGYSELFDWYLESPNIRLDYANEAIGELGADDVFHILTGGQYLYFEGVAFEIYDVSLNLVETLKEEEEDNQEDTQETWYYYGDDENQEDTQE